MHLPKFLNVVMKNFKIIAIKLKRKISDMNSDSENASVYGFSDFPKAKKSKTWNEESCTKTNNWAYLPSIVIHEIFDLLDPRDRQNASSVCKNWRQNLFHPKWWPSVTFQIKENDRYRAKIFNANFATITTNARIIVNTLNAGCITEFLHLIENLSDNNNLRELIIEPTHCHFDMSVFDAKKSKYRPIHVIETLKRCLPNLTTFSIGCIENLAHYLDEYLAVLAQNQPHKVQRLGLASVKDNPNEYEAPYFDNELIKAFTGLKVLSVDFDQLSDYFLQSLDGATKLERLVIHLHGLNENHPGSSNIAWKQFKAKHPRCELRINVIHSFDEIDVLHETILKEEMPLSHLKVFFCENVIMDVLEYIARFYAETMRSLVWVDSFSNSKASWAFFSNDYENSPDPLITIAWLCKNLEELVFYGYKYCEENLIAIARLRGDKLKKFEFAEENIYYFDNIEEDLDLNIVVDMKKWEPIKTANLHPVICNPICGDSDEYLLPIVLADLH